MENWKEIKDYEGLYEISDWGNVRRLNYNKTGKPKLLKPRKNNSGYLMVCLWKDGECKKKRVHRLVAEAFLPNPNNLPEVNHIDEDKTNNVCTTTNCNLEWCTSSYNYHYGTRIQRVADSNSIAIDQFDKDGNFIKRWKSVREAERQLGINHGNIVSCLKGKRKTAGEFVWRYYSSENWKNSKGKITSGKTMPY